MLEVGWGGSEAVEQVGTWELLHAPQPGRVLEQVAADIADEGRLPHAALTHLHIVCTISCTPLWQAGACSQICTAAGSTTGKAATALQRLVPAACSQPQVTHHKHFQLACRGCDLGLQGRVRAYDIGSQLLCSLPTLGRLSPAEARLGVSLVRCQDLRSVRFCVVHVPAATLISKSQAWIGDKCSSREGLTRAQQLGDPRCLGHHCHDLNVTDQLQAGE